MTQCSNDGITNMLPTIVKGEISLELSKVRNSVKVGVKVRFGINAWCRMSKSAGAVVMDPH